MEKKKEKLSTAPDCLIFISLASMYLDNGMVDEAIDLCKSGLEINPQNEEAHLILAKAEIEKGKKEDAKKRLVELIERNPENTSARELLSQIEIQLREVQEEKKEEIEEKKETPVTEEIKASQSVVMKEEIKPKKKEEVELVKHDEIETLFIEKISKITQIEGIINCFFRLKDGRVIKSPDLMASFDDLTPLLDSLLVSVKSASKELDLGRLKILIIEIEKGVFYIFETEDFDCFLVSNTTDNFGFVKAVLPKILKKTSGE